MSQILCLYLKYYWDCTQFDPGPRATDVFAHLGQRPRISCDRQKTTLELNNHLHDILEYLSSQFNISFREIKSIAYFDYYFSIDFLQTLLSHLICLRLLSNF